MSATTVPERLGKYEVRGTLGKGAMGVVYSGWDPIISRKVAIKTVRLPDASEVEAQEELARFKREAQAAGRLTHPNIVGVFDYGETEMLAYIVMEFVDGQTLKSLLDAGERLALPQVARVMGDVLAGLRYSHERGVVHRDIKPANIMIVGGDGHGSGQAKIADFGIARIESSNLTQAGTIMGTPAYMSPEQFMGQTVDARTDIYSAGVLLFQLLTGDRPFEGSMATIMHKALNTMPPLPSELSVTAPRALDPVVTRAMAKRPEDRFQSAGAFADAITAALAQPAQSGLGPGLADLDSDSTVVRGPAVRAAAAPSVGAGHAPAATSRRPMLVGIGALALALVGGGLWFAVPSLTGRTKVADTTPPVGRIELPANPPKGDVPPSPSSPPDRPVSKPIETASQPEQREGPTTPKPTVIVPPSAPIGQSGPTVAGTGEPSGRARNNVLADVPLQQAEVPPPASGIATSPAAAEPTKPPAPLASSSAPATATSSAVPVYVPPRPEAAGSAPSAPSVAPPPPPAVSAPPAQQQLAGSVALAPEALRQAVGQAVRGAECAVVGGDVSRSSGLVTLRGVVGRGRPEQALLGSVRDAAPTAALDWAIGVAEGPYCSALNLVRGYARPFGAASGGMEVGLKDNATRLVEDQQVEIVTQAPEFPSYIEVDYYQNDGKVAHLRNSATGIAAVPSRSQQTFDGGTVVPPFGTDVIIAIASSTPLFGRERPQIEESDKYLRDLRSALDVAKNRRAQIAAGVAMVQTGPKP